MVRFSLIFIGSCITAMTLIVLYASLHHNPNHIWAEGKLYLIIPRNFGETESYTVYNDKQDTVCTFCGSTDLLNDGADLYWLDIDSDGRNELYCEASPRGAYLKFYPDKPPHYFELSDDSYLPGTQTWLFKQIHAGWIFTGDFFNEQAVLALGVIAGMITLIVSLIVRFIKRKKFSRD
jgi:hypothetical protein